MKALAVLCALTGVTAADNKCAIEKVPSPRIPKVAQPACHRPSSALASTLVREISKGFTPTHDKGKASVKFPCDGLGARIDEITLETGNGHGGTLGLFRASRLGDKFAVRGIVYRGASMVYQPKATPWERVAGTVAIDLERLRAATTAEVTEVVPPAKPGEALGTSGSFSSHDFHILIRLVDSDGRIVERQFTGYESSSDQAKFLGPLVAAEALAPITSLATNQDPVDHTDLELFAERFNAAVAHFDDQFYWWVMERYVDLARFFGTPRLIGGLLTRLTVKDPKSRSQVDARKDALAALANITGWDARKTTTSDDRAAAEYLARCR